MAKRERETADMEAFCKRVMVAIRRRADNGDMETVEVLSDLELFAQSQLVLAVMRLRGAPWCYSWTDIGNALGITRQAAQQRFGVQEAPAER